MSRIQRAVALGLVGIAFLLVGCDEPDRNSQVTTSTTTVDAVTGVSTTTTSTANFLNTAGGLQISDATAFAFFATPEPYTDSMTPALYLDQLFNKPFDPRLKVYIPAYSYFQGVAYSPQNLQVLGQVRLLGSAMTEGPTSQITLANGAMITTEPDYLADKIKPAQNRYKVLEWKEVQ